MSHASQKDIPIYTALMNAGKKDVLCYKDGDTSKSFWVRFRNDGTDRVSYWVNKDDRRHGRVFSGHMDRFAPCPM